MHIADCTLQMWMVNKWQTERVWPRLYYIVCKWSVYFVHFLFIYVYHFQWRSITDSWKFQNCISISKMHGQTCLFMIHRSQKYPTLHGIYMHDTSTVIRACSFAVVGYWTVLFICSRFTFLALGESYAWWRHQMETFSALLALCAGNSPVTGEFPHKGQWRGALMFSLIWAE